MIEKTYFYGPGEAGVEQIHSLDDFIIFHIQSEEVGLSIADSLAAGLDDWNDQEDHMLEVYRCTDTDRLSEAIKERNEA